MSKAGKARRAVMEKIQTDKTYPLAEAFNMLKQNAHVKFDESIEVSINLGIDPKKGDQVVRGAVDLPNGLGKTIRVAVFARGDKAEAAEKAGADAVGLDDLAERVQKGDFDFDVVLASSDAMPTVGKLGKILGPKGLMPNPKQGMVTDDLATAVKNVKSGRAKYRNDKGGIIHAIIGKINFEVSKLEENFDALIQDVVKARPSTVKGIYLKKVTVSSTMGLGLTIDRGDLKDS